MKGIDKVIIVAGILAAFLAVGFVLPMLKSGSNCGGNSVAEVACGNYAMCIKIHDDNDKQVALNICGLPPSDRMELINFATSANHSPESAKFLVRTNILINANPRQIIIVCDTPFDNVPQPTFWNGYRKNPAHAVGYSDGSRGLIKIEEFKKLDLSGFADVTALETNAVSVLVNTNQGSF